MSYTRLCRAPLDYKGAIIQGLKKIPFEEGLFKTASSSAIFSSPPIKPPLLFDELIGSWNAQVPSDASLEMEARAEVGGKWSPWFILGTQKGSRFYSPPSQKNSFGAVDIDTLKLKKKASALEYRFVFSAPRQAITLELSAVNVSNSEASKASAAPFKPGPWVREIKLTPRSQMEESSKYRRDVCSPTSLGMVLSYWGLTLKTAEIAQAVRDQETQDFGDWTFNAAFAGSLGLVSYVSRFDSLREIEWEIAQGRPVIASIAFKKGELPGAPIKKTSGHLLVVSGFTLRGDVIVYDPAAPKASLARRIYPRAAFDHAWRVNKRGLVYLVGPLKGMNASIGVPVSDLMAAPVPYKIQLDDPKHLSQLLYGEKITLLQARKNWVQIAAMEQLNFKNGRWQGYHGWIQAEDISFAPLPKVNSVIRTRQAILHQGSKILNLSVGTQLDQTHSEGKIATVRLADDTTAEIDSSSLYPFPSPPNGESRSEIIRASELFLGTSYYWGGRSGVQPNLSIGVDCSGLVSLAYRVVGLNIPRDSEAQKKKSRPVANSELEPADLIFLSDPKRPGRISHVMIYTGGDGFIESRESSRRVLRSSFKERFGKFLAQIKSGSAVMDHSYPKPKKRFIYFGSYLEP